MFVFVDMLRGLAALLVFWFHLDLHILCGYPGTPVPPDSLTYWLVYGFTDLGRYGVAIFFMISGFLIPSTLRGPKASLRTYALHRFFRLYPAYWVAIAAWAAVAAWLPSGDGQPGARDALLNLTMLQKFLSVPDVIGAFWTLPIELLFYFACAFLFWSRSAWSWLRLLGLSITTCLVLAGVGRVSATAMPLAPLFAFTLMFLADGARQALESGRGGGKVALAATAVAALLVPANLLGYEAQEAWRFITAYWMAMATFFACLLLRGAIASSRPVAAASRFLADISYSVYLLHAPLGMTTAQLVQQSTGSAALGAASGLALTVAAAWVVFTVVEAPAIRLGRRLSSRAATPARATGQA